MTNFRSDNNAGLCPEALKAILEAAGGHVVAYGDDVYTHGAVEQFRVLFGSGTEVYFVATGTAANTLAIASLTDIGERVFCHRYAHVANAESTAPERIAGCRVTEIATADSKLTPEVIEHWMKVRHNVHYPQPGVVTITNPTEFGELYTAQETRALCTVAHAHGYRVHVDGARFASAVAGLGCSPREISVDAGVDALTFGGTKNGLAGGEAVLFFRQGDGAIAERAADRFAYQRKSTGHLLSKHRFVTAPFLATLKNDVWLKHAGHANAMATLLGDALIEASCIPKFPVQANGVFVELADEVHDALATKGYTYHLLGEQEWKMARFMMSFDTDADQVHELGREIIEVRGMA